MLRAILISRKTGRIWLAAGIFLTAIAVLVPNAAYPLLTLCALIGATASGYLAPTKKTVFVLAAVAGAAAVAVWAGPGELTNSALQWLAAALVLVFVTAGVVHYIRGLEERAFEYGWQAELSSEAADLGMFKWDFSSDIVQASEKIRNLYGLPATGPLFGDEFFGRMHNDDRDRVRRDVEAAQVGDGRFRSEFRIVTEDKSLRWLAGRGRIIEDPRSGDISLAGVNFDITDVKERENLISKLIDGVAALFALTTPDGKILELNKFGEAQSGLTADNWRGGDFSALTMWGRSVESRSIVTGLLERARTAGQVTGEAPFWSPDGDKGWALVTVTPLETDWGRPLYLCISAIDISKRKHAEEYNALLVQELNHRIRNLFSVTNALINLSARHAKSVDEFADSTRKRLMALHAAHNIGAVNLRKRDADLKEIVTVTLQPWRTEPQRIFIGGEPRDFDAGVATAWALIVHELASNAAKNGSLAQPEGRLFIDWGDDEDGFLFRWREKIHSPTDEKGAHTGFGADIVSKLIAGYLGGELERNIFEDGLEVTIRIRRRADAPERVIVAEG